MAKDSKNCATGLDGKKTTPVKSRAEGSDSWKIQTRKGAYVMSMVTTKDGTEIYYKDWGSKDAQPIVFHHGWPLSGDDWDAQLLYFLGKGYRVIAHDRRGHGRSAQVSDGHDIDHYAADAAAVFTTHAEVVNPDLPAFIRIKTPRKSAA
jgi:predicted acyl esterase